MEYIAFSSLLVLTRVSTLSIYLRKLLIIRLWDSWSALKTLARKSSAGSVSGLRCSKLKTHTRDHHAIDFRVAPLSCNFSQNHGGVSNHLSMRCYASRAPCRPDCLNRSHRKPESNGKGNGNSDPGLNVFVACIWCSTWLGSAGQRKPHATSQ
ncbi:hypothetical protein BCR34DRAFT_82147 [Clohesyomyces aquaticus]|uniref:Uncharacterized protein n=1 Tax=Clohesyomyces aquaticus TaxID=1231657 RepID=A0A1Y1YWR9_9PLEO|nr:hypothetical protein BCR34DRAFT_82147 [Clohesyomyces aquaticus]